MHLILRTFYYSINKEWPVFIQMHIIPSTYNFFKPELQFKIIFNLLSSSCIFFTFFKFLTDLLLDTFTGYSILGCLIFFFLCCGLQNIAVFNFQQFYFLSHYRELPLHAPLWIISAQLLRILTQHLWNNVGLNLFPSVSFSHDSMWHICQMFSLYVYIFHTTI